MGWRIHFLGNSDQTDAVVTFLSPPSCHIMLSSMDLEGKIVCGQVLLLM